MTSHRRIHCPSGELNLVNLLEALTWPEGVSGGDNADLVVTNAGHGLYWIEILRDGGDHFDAYIGVHRRGLREVGPHPRNERCTFPHDEPQGRDLSSAARAGEDSANEGEGK